MTSKTTIILGPPGTGKTTALLRLMEDRLDKGVPANRIGYVSFTNKAADEARDRAMDKFDLAEESFPYFRTLHSMCFRLLGIRREQVLASSRHKRELAARLKVDLDLRGTSLEHGEFMSSGGTRKGDALLFWNQKARNRALSSHEICRRDPPVGFSPEELEQFSVGYKSFKTEMGLCDFTDMLEQFCSNGGAPHLDTLFVDEAQDLTLLQWNVVWELARSVDRVYVAGDDDQAIYDWAGADSSVLVGLEGERMVLSQSYRVPEKIHSVAQRIIRLIPPSQRIEKAYAPRPVAGQVQKVPSAHDLPLKEGQWMVLARNLYFLEEVRNLCFEAGYSFSYRKHSPISPGVWKAIVIWERLRNNFTHDAASLKEIQHLYQFIGTGSCGVRRGAKQALRKMVTEGAGDTRVCMEDLSRTYGLCADGSAPWQEVLDRVPGEYVSYLDACHRNGEDPSVPRITMNTIHSAKGGECENVAVFQDMSLRTYRAFEQDPASEARTFYVAVTRAKENLFIVEPQGPNYFPIA